MHPVLLLVATILAGYDVTHAQFTPYADEINDALDEIRALGFFPDDSGLMERIAIVESEAGNVAGFPVAGEGGMFGVSVFM